MLRTQSDERLVELARGGSEPAFEAIVDRYRGALEHYCRRFVRQSSVDDVVQQTFISAYHALQEDSGDLHLRAWLFRVGHNAGIDALRAEARGWEELGESNGGSSSDLASEGKQALRDLLAGIHRLPECQRTAIVLREMEGRSYEEISEELGISEGAVSQVLARARRRLQAGASAVMSPFLLMRPRAAAGGGTLERVTEALAGPGPVKALSVIAVVSAVGGAAITPRGEERPARPERAAREPGHLGTQMSPARLDVASGGWTSSEKAKSRRRPAGAARGSAAGAGARRKPQGTQRAGVERHVAPRPTQEPDDDADDRGTGAPPVEVDADEDDRGTGATPVVVDADEDEPTSAAEPAEPSDREDPEIEPPNSGDD